MSDNTVHTEDYKGYTIEIWRDEMPENPREWDTFGTMVCFHGRYDLGDKHNFSIDEAKELAQSEDVISLPLYLYDHSGITMSTECVYPYNDRWDAGQVGFIYVTKENIRKEFNVKRISPAVMQKAFDLLRSEVKLYDHYLCDDDYGYSITVVETPEVIDSCGGYLGEYEYALQAAKEVIDYKIEQEKENAEV
jgi:hypothetical protein